MVRILSAALASAALVSTVLGLPTRRAMVVHELRETPRSFASAGTPSTNTTVNLRVALTSKDTAGLEKALYDVSTPGSALYGQHLSLDQVKAYVAPTPDSVSAVTQWLNENGISNVTTSGAFGDWLTFSTSVSTANSLLNANFKTFVNTETNERVIRTLQYSLPQDLLQHVDLVHPTTSFAQPRRNKPVVSIPASGSSNITARANTAPSSCDKTVTPTCLQDLYGIPSTAATESSNTLGVSGFIDQFAQKSDLKSFLSQFRSDVSSSTTFALLAVDDGADPQGARDAGIEANLDIQYTVGVATGVPVTFVSVGDDNTDGEGGFLDIINFLNGQQSPPQVLTTSYGADETGISSSMANKLCNAYMALGARGVSILFSSGDGGVSGSQSQTCSTFIPTFPSGCPYLTSVGATQGVDETAADFSSGGFSNVFSAPSYQSSAVAGYLKTLGKTNSGLFNSSGRGFPDVAAQGVSVDIVSGGSTQTVDGTSCSSPIFASVVSLINDRLIAAGKPALGFLNPFLYQNPQAFFDVTTGSNPGCNTNGFPAATGWDPVTGLGTPNFNALLSAAGVS